MNTSSRKVSYENLTTLTKTDLVYMIERKLGVQSMQAKSLSDAILDTVRGALVNKESVLLSKIGTLAVTHKAERPGRNPKTKEEFKIKPRYTVTLRNGKKTEGTRLNQPEILAEIGKSLPNVPAKTIKAAFKTFLEFLAKVKDGKTRVEIRGQLGVFYPSVLPEREARNPKTGEKVIAKEKVIIHFTCSKLIKQDLEKFAA